MFILQIDHPPATVDELIDAITQSLIQSIDLPSGAKPVRIDGALPGLESLSVDVSNGRVKATQSLPDRNQLNSPTPGPTVQTFSVIGNPVRITDIPVRINLNAKAVRFKYDRTPSGKIMAIPDDAAEGRLEINIAKQPLDAGLLLLGKKFSASHGVEILKVETGLVSTSPADLNVSIKITAKKFMTAVIDVTGQIHVDDRMRLTATNLKAFSSGMVGNVAVGLLQPQLNKLEGRSLPLLRYSMGNLKLIRIAIDTTDGLTLTAFLTSGTK